MSKRSSLLPVLMPLSHRQNEGDLLQKFSQGLRNRVASEVYQKILADMPFFIGARLGLACVCLCMCTKRKNTNAQTSTHTACAPTHANTNTHTF